MWTDIDTDEQEPVRSFIEEARRAQIVEHTIEVLAEVGYSGASLALIAQRAGISKGVISYHFKGKADLMDEVERQINRSMRAAIAPRVEAQATPGGMLREFIRANLDYMRAKRSNVIASIEIFYMRTHGNDRRPEYGMFDYEPMLENLDLILAAGQASGEFTAFDTRIMAITVWSAIEGALTQWSADPDLDLEKYADELVCLFDRATRANTVG